MDGFKNEWLLIEKIVERAMKEYAREKEWSRKGGKRWKGQKTRRVLRREKFLSDPVSYWPQDVNPDCCFLILHGTEHIPFFLLVFQTRTNHISDPGLDLSFFSLFLASLLSSFSSIFVLFFTARKDTQERYRERERESLSMYQDLFTWCKMGVARWWWWYLVHLVLWVTESRCRHLCLSPSHFSSFSFCFYHRDSLECTWDSGSLNGEEEESRFKIQSRRTRSSFRTCDPWNNFLLMVSFLSSSPLLSFLSFNSFLRCSVCEKRKEVARLFCEERCVMITFESCFNCGCPRFWERRLVEGLKQQLAWHDIRRRWNSCPAIHFLSFSNLSHPIYLSHSNHDDDGSGCCLFQWREWKEKIELKVDAPLFQNYLDMQSTICVLRPFLLFSSPFFRSWVMLSTCSCLIRTPLSLSLGCWLVWNCRTEKGKDMHGFLSVSSFWF